MTDIPDEVVERALAAFGFDPTGCNPQDYVTMRAAGRVFVEWERERIAAYLDSIQHTETAKLVRSRMQ